MKKSPFFQTISQSDGLGGRLQAESGIFTSGGSTFRSATHRLFVNNILRRVTNSQLHRRAADQARPYNDLKLVFLIQTSVYKSFVKNQLYRSQTHISPNLVNFWNWKSGNKCVG